TRLVTMARRTGLNQPDSMLQSLLRLLIVVSPKHSRPRDRRNSRQRGRYCNRRDRGRLSVWANIDVGVPGDETQAADILAMGVARYTILLLIIGGDSLPGVLICSIVSNQGNRYTNFQALTRRRNEAICHIGVGTDFALYRALIRKMVQIPMHKTAVLHQVG